MLTRLFRTPSAWVAVVALGAGAALGLWWFQPWKLVTDAEVDEELSVVATAPPSAPATGDTSATPTPAPPGPTVVRSGEFVTHEHDTSGTARIVRDADGRHRLELVGLDTSNGPDLRV